MRARTLLVVIVGLAAVIQDLGWARISNWTSGGAVIAGLIVHLTHKGWSGSLHSLFGAMIGFSIFLIFYLLGGMGGGDLELMAGFGALLGDGHILWAALVRSDVRRRDGGGLFGGPRCRAALENCPASRSEQRENP
jgi:prepilin peptidase CpaA